MLSYSFYDVAGHIPVQVIRENDSAAWYGSFLAVELATKPLSAE